MFRNRSIFAELCLFVLCLGLGCGSGQRTPDSSTLLVKPDSLSLLLNQTAQLQAVANSASGSSVDVTSAVVWTLTNPLIAQINSQGLLTCEAAGAAGVTATSQGTTATTRVNCAVRQISISGVPAHNLVGQTAQLHVTTSSADGISSDITPATVWTVAVPSIANIGVQGLLTCKAVG